MDIAQAGRRVLVSVVWLLALAGAAAAQVQRTFVNLGFELPSAGASVCYFQVGETLVPGWTTNHPVQNGVGCAPDVAQTPGPLIEIWRSGFSSVNARSGTQFAELNAEAAARIFQNVCLASGELVGWRFSHRGRQSATTNDVTEFRVGSTPNTHRVVRAGTQNDGGGGVQTCYGTTSTGDGNVRSNSCTTATASNGWRDYSGSFTWQGATGAQAIGFEAISAAGGATIGNFIDDIQMTLRPFVELTTATAHVREGAANTLPALRVAGTVPAGGISVQLTITGGTATRGSDYTTGSGTDTLTVSVPAGVYDGNDFPLPLTLIDDAVIEDNETITLSITSSPTNYVLSSTQTCGAAAITSTTIALRDNDIDLASSLDASVATALGGESVTYTYVVRNNTARPTSGDATSHDAAVPFALSAATGLALTSWTCTASGGAQCPGGSVNGTVTGSGAISGTATLPAGTAAAGGQVSYAITATISPTHCTGITQSASLASPPGLAEGTSLQSGFVSPVPAGSGDNSASHTLSIHCLAPLTISKTDNAATYTPGGAAIYVIDLGNTGPSTATALQISDTLPDGLTLSGTPTCTATGAANCGTVSGSSGGNSAGNSAGINGATLPAGSSHGLRLSIPVNVAASVNVAQLVNLASASSAVSPMVTASDSNARPNQAPVAQAASVSVAGNGSAQITLIASDADGDPLTFHIDTLPTHGTLSGTAPTLTYTPTPGYSGSDHFTFHASDTALDSAPATISLSVSAVNRAPVITSPAVTGATPTTPYRYDVTASDPDADSLTFTLPLAPPGMQIDPASGRIDWQADPALAEGVAASNPQCRAPPEQDPTLTAWPISTAVAWRSSPSVIHTPLVGRVVDTNADGRLDAADHPSVIVLQGNRLVARDGVNGALLWQSASSDFGTWGATPALGDSDGDGWPEIYAWTSTRAVASFTAQGAERWRSAPLIASTTLATLGLADLDGDGQAEVLAGNAVLHSASGTLRWRDSADYNFATPVAVDLDGNGSQEVLMGSRVLNADGTLRWTLTHPSVAAAVNHVRWGVGNLDADPAPELVAVYASQVLVLDADGTIRPGFPQTFANERNLSNPALGDLDGDGQAEIVFATHATLRALRADGSQVWETLSDDDSAFATPSVFDFDGDNRDEVVFGGHGSVRILDGRSGAQRLKYPVNSQTWLESVAIADADGDGRAELLFGDAVGLTVLREAQNQWPATRPWWNQHAYTVAGIADDGRIPARPAPPGAQFRGNGLAAGHPRGQPDLALFALAEVNDTQGTQLVVRARNRGLAASAASSVRFSSGAALLGEAALPALAAGATQDIALALAAGTVLDSHLRAQADAADTVAECSEDNNTAQAVRVTVQASDPAGLSDRQTFLITTRADNQAPQWLTTGLPDVRVGAVYAAPVQAVDSDMGDALRYGAVSVPAGSGVDDLGRFVWTPTPAQVGSHEVTLRVTDLAGATAQRSFTLLVLPNALPVVTALPPGGALAGQPYAGTLAAQDADGDPLRYTLNRGPAGLSLDDGQVQWTPLPSQAGLQTVRATISDDHGGATPVEWLIRVERRGQAPVFTSTPVTEGYAGREYRYAVTASDADGDTLTYSLVGTRPGALAIDANSGLLRWPVPWAGSFPLTVRVSDSQGHSTDQRYDLEIRAAGSASRAPAFSTLPPPRARVGRAYVYASRAVDPDGDAVSYALQAAPAGMTVDAAGNLTWTPPASGEAPVTLRAADASQYVEQHWTIAVQPADAPLDVQVSLLPSAPQPGAPLQVQIRTTESSPGLQVSAMLDGQPVSLALGTTTLSAPLIPGRHELAVTLTDGPASGTQTLAFGVVDPADQQAPLVSLAAPLEGSRITAPVPVRGSVSDAHLLDWFLALRPANSPATPVSVIARGTTPVSAAELGVFDPTLLLNGQYELILEARDASGRTSVASTVVRVEGDMKVGHFSLTFEDVNLPVAGLPIRITRTYDTRRRAQALDFGQGWSVDTQNVRVSESHRTGYGWQLQVSGSGAARQFCVRPASARRVSVTLPDGQVESFLAKAQPECATLTPYAAYVNLVYVPEAGTTATLTQQSFGTLRVSDIAGEAAEHLIDPGDASLPADPTRYRLTTREGVVYDIDQTTGVSQVREPGGNTLTYSATGIVHSSGQAVRFVRDGRQRIQRIVLPGGQERRYDYSPDGDLLASYDALQQATRYTYKPGWPHYLESLTDARGVRVQRNEYDGEGRLVAAIDADGRRIDYDHLIADRREVITNRRGHATSYVYDDEGRVLAQTNALGETTAHSYDADGNELTRTDALGQVTTWTYDAYGNRLSEKNPLHQVQRWEYNTRNALTRQFSAVDPARVVLTQTYDPTWFELRSSQDALGQVTTLSYDRGTPSWNTGELRKLIDPSGALTEFIINPRGWTTEQIDALGTRTRYTHDANGQVLSQTTPRSVPGGSPVDQVTTTVYDAKGRVIQTTQPDGSVATTVWNAVDLPAQECVQQRCITFTYDNQGRLTRTTHPNGTWESKAYDENGNVVAQTDTEGRTIKSVFDAADRLVETILPDETPDDADNPRTRQVYDAAGRLEMAIDANGNITSYGYDAADRQIRVTNALGQSTTTQYDADGKRIAMTDTAGRTAKFIYDLAGRLTETVHPDVGTDDGNDANNPRTRSDYDASGRKLAEHDEHGRTTRFAYDKLGRLIAVFLPDPATGSNPPLNPVTGNALPTSPHSGVLVTRYAYDEAGNKLTQTTPSCATAHGGSGGDGCAATANTGVITTWRYDNAGRVLSRTLPLGQVETFQYDSFGRRSQHTDFRGRVTGYSYHADTDWLARIDYATQADVSLHYTQGGQLREVQDGNGTTTYTRDALGRLTQVSWPQRPGMTAAPTLSYQYDAAGNRTRLTTPNQVIDYSFDALNRLVSVTPQGAVEPVARYSYDEVGNRATLAYDNGTTTTYSYNRRNRLTGIQHKAGAALLLGVAYTLDPSGLRTGIAETGAINRQVSYTYDAVKRLTSESVIAASGDRRTSWVYDRTGNRLTQVQHVGPAGAETGTATTAYVYDANDRLSTETTTVTGSLLGINENNISNGGLLGATETQPASGAHKVTAGQTTYTYDAAGNTIKKVAPDETVDYIYDDANRLAELQTLAGEVTRYTYNHDGIRISQTRDATGANATTTHYLVDPNQAYAQVIEESTQAGTSAAPTLTALYTLGDDRIRQQRPAQNGSGGSGSGSGGGSGPGPGGSGTPTSLRYYHADGLGSTRLLTNQTSTPTDHYAYHAFGEIDTVASQQTSDNHFLFTGEQLDPNSGFYYLRARYMNSANGRFTQQDSFDGLGNDPPSLHKYLYTPSNPANYTDPSGKSYLGALSFAASLTLTAISIANTTIVAHDFLTGERELSAKEVGLAIVWAYVGSKSGPLFGKLERALQKAGCLSNSFVGETLVETDKGAHSIDSIAVGDLVLSRNMESGENELQPVTSVQKSTKLVELIKITLESGAVIEATAEHLIYAGGKWRQAKDIVFGELLSDRTSDSVKVVVVSRMIREETVYDLTVANNRNFFVSKAYVLVHNISPCELAARGIALSLPKACRAYGACDDFAKAMENVLLRKDMKGKRLCVRSLSNKGAPYSDTVGKLGDNSHHYGIQVGDYVFDNLRPEGMPRAEWIADLGGPAYVGAPGSGSMLELFEEDLGSLVSCRQGQ